MKEEEAQPSRIPLTSLEQIMYKMLTEVRSQFRLPFSPFVQYPLGRYRADFAIPQLKLAIECDGHAFHSAPDKKAQDQKRDAELAKYGWTTVRFREIDLKENKGEVAKTLTALIFRLWKHAIKMQGKKTSSADLHMPNMRKYGGMDDMEFINLTQQYCDSCVSLPLGIVPMDMVEILAESDPNDSGTKAESDSDKQEKHGSATDQEQPKE